TNKKALAIHVSGLLSMRDGRFATPKFPQAARRSRAAAQRDELAPFHCPIPPVLPTERIAHLSYGGEEVAVGVQYALMTGWGQSAGAVWSQPSVDFRTTPKANVGENLALL